jgi:phosphatidylinositol-bisphosphatase
LIICCILFLFVFLSREPEFTKGAECTVFCGTWNVNAKKQEGGLEDWLLPENNQKNIDIYAIGFQEIVDLNAVNVALNSNNTQQRAQFWEEKISQCLEATGIRYRLIGEKFLVGLLLCVYVREPLLPLIRDVRATSLGVGIMGMMGNKGGVSVRFSVYDSTLCFICSHLAAHRENVTGRNNDYKNIHDKSVFSINESYATNKTTEGGGGDPSMSTNPSSSSLVSSSSTPDMILDSIIMPRQGAARYYDLNVNIPDHDIILWMGDLNYRIDDSLLIEDIFKAIERNELEVLRPKDQLNIERAKNHVFHGFQEGQLNFAPTYKYQPGTDLYETRAEKKLRAPAWCDRILYKNTNQDLIIKQLDYRRSKLIPSDHKPVSSNFHVTLKEVVESKERIVFKELMSFLKKYPSDKLPVLDMQGLKINYEKVLFEMKKDSVIEIKNVGETIAYWHFVPKMEETAVCKKWISLDKVSGLLLPNEVRRSELLLIK